MMIDPPDIEIGDTAIVFLLNDREKRVHQLTGMITAKRGLCRGFRKYGSNDGSRLGLVINGWLTATLRDDEDTFAAGRFRNFSDVNFSAKNDVVFRSERRWVGDHLDWLGEIPKGRWGLRNVLGFSLAEDGSTVLDTTGNPMTHRKTYISFEDANDAIHYKLRWVG
jgi:hypothetical protein